MLRVKIELVPFGFMAVENSWLTEIANDGTGTHSLSSYDFRIYTKNSTTKIWKKGRVENFQRLNKSVWYLFYLCLKQIYGE
jgi:hypothetical protein